MFIERVKYCELELALIVRANYHSDGIEFFTPPSYSQQIGYMNRAKGYLIEPHIHNPVIREVRFTNEVLIIRKGIIRVDFYSIERQYLFSRELIEGDIILLIEGGHGFEILEDAEIIEVKQGPYAGDMDKTKFSSDIFTK